METESGLRSGAIPSRWEFERAFVDQAGAKFKENITKAIEKLRLMLEERQTSLSMIDQPPLIASSERFLTAPLKSTAR
jgi:hypothetical protein